MPNLHTPQQLLQPVDLLSLRYPNLRGHVYAITFPIGCARCLLGNSELPVAVERQATVAASSSARQHDCSTVITASDMHFTASLPG